MNLLKKASSFLVVFSITQKSALDFWWFLVFLGVFRYNFTTSPKISGAAHGSGSAKRRQSEVASVCSGQQSAGRKQQGPERRGGRARWRARAADSRAHAAGSKQQGAERRRHSTEKVAVRAQAAGYITG